MQVDEHEMLFETNHLGNFLLTNLLLDNKLYLNCELSYIECAAKALSKQANVVFTRTDFIRVAIAQICIVSQSTIGNGAVCVFADYVSQILRKWLSGFDIFVYILWTALQICLTLIMVSDMQCWFLRIIYCIFKVCCSLNDTFKNNFKFFFSNNVRMNNARKSIQIHFFLCVKVERECLLNSIIDFRLHILKIVKSSTL